MDYNDLFQFFDEIAANNTREFFQANRKRYDELRQMWLADIERLINAIASWEPALASATPRSVAYRFARDTRFSSDKSPYKTFFSAAFVDRGRKSCRAGYYIQTGNGFETSSGLWGGIWHPESATLKKLRRAIVDNIEEFNEIITEPRFVEIYGEQWAAERLLTAPQGWPRDHELIELLRLKEYGKVHRLDREFFAAPDWPEKAAGMFRPLKPLVDFLNYSIDE